ncbi:MAG TPA: hypothetical protein VN633_13115 [Bryobacteraceae bacterium]|nr:hypothetical protein [Bryobacteraceae bacterium]
MNRKSCRPLPKRAAASYLTVALVLGACVSAIAFRASAQNARPVAVTAQALMARERKGVGFPDFGFMVTPSEYAAKYSNQPIFRLKADFPREMPKDLPAFLSKIDFRKDPLAYMLAVRAYAFEGNIPTWDPHKNHVRQWYHIPWLHPTTIGPSAYPPNGGTEGFHGLIKEAPITPYQLGPDQKGKDGDYSVYAITLINDFAGYTMGKMWRDPDNPDPRVTDSRFGGGFPIGTVFAKLLFTDAPQGTDKVAYLENPLQWKAYITQNFWTSSTREVTNVNLLQMDIAVRDARANGPDMTGWVFGTFVYNGQLNHPNKFMNLVPAGLMWGNDPEDRTNTTNPFPPTKTEVNPKLKQTVIFNTAQLPPQHLGWNGRLNGPADLNTTSCMSCHIAAQYPAVTSLVPDGAVPDGGPTPPVQGGTDEWMKWFQNLRCATSMDPRAYSTDFSFQVAIALENFFNVKSAREQGMWTSDYALPTKPIARGELKP